MLGAAAPTRPPLSPQTTTLIGYGLLLGGAAIVGKLMIDGLVGDMDAAKARRQFIGPIQEIPQPVTMHVKLGDVVRFVTSVVSFYSIVSELPSLTTTWGQIQSEVNQLVK